MQLFVGGEVLDVKEQDMRASNMHLFIRHKDVQQVQLLWQHGACTSCTCSTP